jgi:hypothetical protein
MRLRWIALFLLLIGGGWYVFLPTFLAKHRSIADGSHECLPNSPNDPDKKTYPSPEPAIKILRLTDSGELVDRCEWTDALYELSRVEKPKRVFVYVHGWHHNAAPDDSDLKHFTQLVEKTVESEKKNGDKRHIVGIYVGWDAATPVPVLEYLTFWDRKLTADRISQSAIFAKFIGAQRSILNKQAQARQEAGTTRDQLIVIGHSLGARVVYSALAQAMIMDLQAAHPGQRGGKYHRIAGPVDALVLLNPALEAGAFSAFHTVQRYQETFDPAQPPMIISVATDNDTATGLAFPAGQWVSLGRSEREMTTLGNYMPFATHTLLAKDGTTSDGPDWPQSLCAGGLCLERAEPDPLMVGNPFFVVRTTSDVVDGHNGIWDARFQTWLLHVFDRIDAGLARKDD